MSSCEVKWKWFAKKRSNIIISFPRSTHFNHLNEMTFPARLWPVPVNFNYVKFRVGVIKSNFPTESKLFTTFRDGEQLIINASPSYMINFRTVNINLIFESGFFSENIWKLRLQRCTYLHLKLPAKFNTPIFTY